MKIGFDNQKYIELQSQKIKERIKTSGEKLYLEFGGKLFDDYHASRVLPGFIPDTKIRMLQELSSQTEIILVVSSENIEKNKIRADIGLTYENEVFRLIKAFKSFDLEVTSVVITKFKEDKNTLNFVQKLKNHKIKYYFHYEIEGYPSNISHILSDSGFGKNDYIETKKPLVVVTAPGPGSGKMATCLSQIYHDYKIGKKSSYAKFETFPVWNLDLNHPVNLAYEAATIDLNDVNMIDPFHLEIYNEKTVNYNRDIEVFPVLDKMFQMISGKKIYKSPTDMGVNMAGFCIFDDDIIKEAAKKEISRRYFNLKCDKLIGKAGENEISKMEMILQKANILESDRKVIEVARKKSKEKNTIITAFELDNGEIITGKSSELMTSGAAAIINILKYFGNIDDETFLIGNDVLKAIQNLKKLTKISNFDTRLSINEVLIAISVTAITNKNAKNALKQLDKLFGIDCHCSHIIIENDIKYLKKLGISVSMDDRYFL